MASKKNKRKNNKTQTTSTGLPKPPHSVNSGKNKNIPVVNPSSAQTHIDVLDRTLVLYIDYCGVGKHVVRDKMVKHQIKLWTIIKQGIVNIDITDIDKYFDHLIKLFYEHRDGVLGEQRLMRYIYDQTTGNTYIDSYAIELYALFQIASERYDDSRPTTLVDLNKAVANAPDDIAEKVMSYFNKLGESPINTKSDKE